MKRFIRLRGISGEIKGPIWESDTLLRAGRLASLEIVLDDSSVSRRHAEVRLGRTAGGSSATWKAPTAPTSTASGSAPASSPLKPRDIVQFGKVAVIVELVRRHRSTGRRRTSWSSRRPPGRPFEDGLRRMAFDRNQMPRAGEQLIALLRAGHHLVHMESEDQLLDSILNDAVSVLDAQRGAIVLADGRRAGAEAAAAGPGGRRAASPRAGSTSARG